MKKITFVLMSVIMSFGIFAKPRNVQDAMSVAQSFVVHSSVPMKKMLSADNSLQLAYTSTEQNQPCFYVFNQADNNGFVIVSADDRTKEVLGYAEQGSFDIEKLPVNFKEWLQVYQEELAYVISLPEQETSGFIEFPMYAKTKAVQKTTSVAPLLGQIQWDQGEPYNLLCPLYDGTNRSVTGCVATAIAQIMRYHNWPVTGKGVSAAYTTTSNKIAIPQINFAATNYDWSNMTPMYNSSSTEAEKNAVATLMYHCGVSVEMDYGESSGAYSSDVPSALYDYFDYDNTMQYYSRKYYTQNEWKSIIKKELDAARPIYYSGQSNGGGHAFVCDGYDTNDFFHFNWGWGGYFNGYFELSALTPGTGGIGAGTADGYNKYQSIVTGIQKPGASAIEQDYILIIDEVPTASVSSTTRKGTFDISVNGLWNKGCNSFSGSLAIALYKNGVFVQQIGSVFNTTDLKQNRGWETRTFSELSIPETIANGTYQLYYVYKPKDSAEWNIIRGLVGTPNFVKVEVTSSALTFSEATEVYPNLTLSDLQVIGNLYQNKLGRYSFKVTNTGGEYASQMATYLVSVTDTTIYQLGTFNPVSIGTGETCSFQFSDSILLSPGKYELYIMYDKGNNFYIAEYVYTLNETPLEVTVLAEPTETPNLVLTTKASFANNDSVYTDNAVLTATIQNTGGYFSNDAIAFIFPENGGGSLTYIGYQTIIVDEGETVSYTFSGNINLLPGKYLLVLYYWYQDSWHSFTPQENSKFVFTLVDSPVTAISHHSSEIFQLYPNPVENILYLRSDDTVNSVQIMDLTGRQICFVQPNMKGTIEIPVQPLAIGTYIINIKTNNGTKVSKFVKKR